VLSDCSSTFLIIIGRLFLEEKESFDKKSIYLLYIANNKERFITHILKDKRKMDMSSNGIFFLFSPNDINLYLKRLVTEIRL
jgi:hypothetical protein